MTSDNPFDNLGLSREVVEELYREGVLHPFLGRYKHALHLTFHPDGKSKETRFYADANQALSEIEKHKGSVPNWLKTMKSEGSKHSELEELVVALSDDVKYRIGVETDLRKKLEEYHALQIDYVRLEKEMSSQAKGIKNQLSGYLEDLQKLDREIGELEAVVRGKVADAQLLGIHDSKIEVVYGALDPSFFTEYRRVRSFRGAVSILRIPCDDDQQMDVLTPYSSIFGRIMTDENRTNEHNVEDHIKFQRNSVENNPLFYREVKDAVVRKIVRQAKSHDAKIVILANLQTVEETYYLVAKKYQIKKSNIEVRNYFQVTGALDLVLEMTGYAKR